MPEKKLEIGEGEIKEIKSEDNITMGIITKVGAVVTILMGIGLSNCQDEKNNRRDLVDAIALTITSDKENYPDIYTVPISKLTRIIGELYDSGFNRAEILSQLKNKI